MRARFTLVAPELPDHLVADTADALAHVGWVGLQRRAVPTDGLVGLHLTGVVPPVTFSHAGHHHEAMVRDLLSGWDALGVSAALITGDLAHRPPSLLVMDADSTLLTSEVIEEIAEHAGVAEEVERVTSAAMRGELDFTESLYERLSLLAGLPLSAVEEVAATVRFSPGAKRLVDEMHEAGAAVGVVSGGFHEVLDPLAERLGIDYVRANRLEVHAGRLTGRPLGPVIDGAAKLAALQEWNATHPGPTVAMGDGANDLKMVEAADLGIAYCAKPILNEAADARIPFPRLDAAALLADIVT